MDIRYYSSDGSLTVFDNYTITTSGVITNKKSEKVLCQCKNADGYFSTCVYINGKPRQLLVARSILSTFVGKPLTPEYTVEHKDGNRGNDVLDNLEWVTKSNQVRNQTRPEMYKSAVIIVKDEVEKTAKEWAVDDDVKEGTIRKYAVTKKHGFSYKVFPDLEGEEWRRVEGSENSQGLWEVSNKNRVKYVTKNYANVLSVDQICPVSGYPAIGINGKIAYCHVLVFRAFYPTEWLAKRPDEIVLHNHDDKLDFHPEHLRLGTRSENGRDAYDNGKLDGMTNERMRCASFVKDVFEKNHESQSTAADYIRSLGITKSLKAHSNISKTLSGLTKSAYGRTWKCGYF